jgi:hypothetical protein
MWKYQQYTIVSFVLICTEEIEIKSRFMRYKIVIFQIQTSYLDLHPEIDSEGRLTTNIYHKGDDFKFPIVNFPF